VGLTNAEATRSKSPLTQRLAASSGSWKRWLMECNKHSCLCCFSKYNPSSSKPLILLHIHVLTIVLQVGLFRVSVRVVTNSSEMRGTSHLRYDALISDLCHKSEQALHRCNGIKM
jgi:hypothetical protein